MRQYTWFSARSTNCKEFRKFVCETAGQSRHVTVPNKGKSRMYEPCELLNTFWRLIRSAKLTFFFKFINLFSLRVWFGEFDSIKRDTDRDCGLEEPAEFPVLTHTMPRMLFPERSWWEIFNAHLLRFLAPVQDWLSRAMPLSFIQTSFEGYPSFSTVWEGTFLFLEDSELEEKGGK